MTHRKILGIALCALLATQSAFAGGGGSGGIDDPRAVRQQFSANMDPQLVQQFQQMDQITNQVLTNMQRAGEDAGAFNDLINAQMSEGTLDVAAVEQDMVAKGYMTAAMAGQINNLMQQMQTGLQQTFMNTTYSRIKQLLHPTEEEWAILQPKVQHVLEAQAVLTEPGEKTNLVLGIGGAMREGPLSPGVYFISQLGAAEAADTELSRARQALQAALANRQTSEATLATTLRTWRALHQKARADLTAAQDDLTHVITLRQEAVLITVGVL